MTRSPIEATVTGSKIKHSDHTVWEIESRSSCLAVYNLQISTGQAHMGVLLVSPPSPFVRDSDLLVLTVTEHNWTIGASNPLSSTQTRRLLVEGAKSVGTCLKDFTHETSVSMWRHPTKGGYISFNVF